MPVTQAMFQRSKCLKRSERWTSYIRSQYPPAANARVVVAWDRQLARWVLAYDTEDVLVASGMPTRVRHLKAFYVWQGPNDSYLEPGPLMVNWLRDHDLFSANNVSEWEDRMFGADKVLKKQRIDSAWDDVQHEIKQIYQPRIIA